MINIKNILNLGWSHGRYVDNWSFVHFFTGIILGIGAIIISSQHFWAFILILLALIIYEYIEILAKVSEGFRNILSDIVIGGLGSALAIFLLPEIMAKQNIFGILGLCVVADLILLFHGWKSFLQRKASEGSSYKHILYVLYFLYISGTLITIASFTYWLV